MNHKETLQSYPGSMTGQQSPEAGKGSYFILSVHEKTNFNSLVKASTFLRTQWGFAWLVDFILFYFGGHYGSL